jgi:hypothetical protein
MTVLTLGRALAVARGRAEPIAIVRHLHFSTRPLVFVPLKMTGAASAATAAMVGTRPRQSSTAGGGATPQPRSTVRVRPQPRSDCSRGDPADGGTADPPSAEPAGSTLRRANAPKIWVPDRAGIEFVRPLGRSTRLPNTTGPWKLPRSVPRMGSWLAFYADRAEYPGSSLLVAATAALAQHRATGQSAEEDEHLGTVLAWIQPPLA